ncbi:MAG: hypothetical protein GY679_04305, partial [Mycoplasma sp.]|nr:hypothetical protein [Mycoplasma sp.]
MPPPKEKTRTDAKCTVCKKTGHTEATCIYKDWKCFRCGQPGHMRSQCTNPAMIGVNVAEQVDSSQSDHSTEMVQNTSGMESEEPAGGNLIAFSSSQCSESDTHSIRGQKSMALWVDYRDYNETSSNSQNEPVEREGYVLQAEWFRMRQILFSSKGDCASGDDASVMDDCRRVRKIEFAESSSGEEVFNAVLPQQLQTRKRKRDAAEYSSTGEEVPKFISSHRCQMRRRREAELEMKLGYSSESKSSSEEEEAKSLVIREVKDIPKLYWNHPELFKDEVLPYMTQECDQEWERLAYDYHVTYGWSDGEGAVSTTTQGQMIYKH